MREPRSAGWWAAASPTLTRLGVRSWLLLGVLGLAGAVLWLLAQVSGFVVPLVLAAVLAAVLDRPHADTDTVLRALRDELPGVSHQAVYDSLHALTGAGLVHRLDPRRSVIRRRTHRSRSG